MQKASLEKKSSLGRITDATKRGDPGGKNLQKADLFEKRVAVATVTSQMSYDDGGRQESDEHAQLQKHQTQHSAQV